MLAPWIDDTCLLASWLDDTCLLASSIAGGSIAVLTLVVHVSECVSDLFEVAHAAHSQRHQQLEASVDGGRAAAYWNGLLRGELPALHVLQVDIRRWEDEVINQLLEREEEGRLSFPVYLCCFSTHIHLNFLS